MANQESAQEPRNESEPAGFESLRLKSYFSGTVEAAMELARTELGDDAMLVNARPATPETRYLGTYEVVFGVPARAAERTPVAPPPLPVTAVANASPTQFAAELEEMRRQIERLSSALTRPAPVAIEVPPTPPALRAPLLSTRFADSELSPELLEALELGARLEDLFRTSATLGRDGTDHNIVMLVGPPGAGKTTTLVKLAARYGLAAHKRAQIITADVNRIAAADQLRALASILGIGCDVVETPLALMQALEEHRTKELVLIDTPGFSPGEMEDAEDLAHMCSAHPGIDTHLVLPASMKPADMSRAADRYTIFQPSKLIFTRLDETTRYGALVSEAARRSLPVSFLCAGQQIPDDLEPATRRKLVDLVDDGTTLRTKGASA